MKYVDTNHPENGGVEYADRKLKNKWMQSGILTSIEKRATVYRVFYEVCVKCIGWSRAAAVSSWTPSLLQNESRRTTNPKHYALNLSPGFTRPWKMIRDNSRRTTWSKLVSQSGEARRTGYPHSVKRSGNFFQSWEYRLGGEWSRMQLKGTPIFGRATNEHYIIYWCRKIQCCNTVKWSEISSVSHPSYSKQNNSDTTGYCRAALENLRRTRSVIDLPRWILADQWTEKTRRDPFP